MIHFLIIFIFINYIILFINYIIIQLYDRQIWLIVSRRRQVFFLWHILIKAIE